MTAFVDEHREVYGVEPICRLLQIAPSTYYDHLAKRTDPDRRSYRSLRDEALGAEIRQRQPTINNSVRSPTRRDSQQWVSGILGAVQRRRGSARDPAAPQSQLSGSPWKAAQVAAVPTMIRNDFALLIPT